MKKIHSIQSAFAFAGCFLGAGFVSGQEIYKFFLFFEHGEVGLLFSMLLIFVFANMIIKLSLKNKNASVKNVLVVKSKFLQKIIYILQVTFLFGLVTIMIAGAGTVTESLFGIRKWIGCAIMSIIICMIAMMGIEGVVKVFSVCVPLITVIGIILCIYVLNISKIDIPLTEDRFSVHDNIFLPNLLLSCIVYAGYNILASIGTLVEYSYASNHKISKISLIIGTILLLIMSLCIYKTLAACENAIYYELPMLEIAKSVNNFAGLIYGILLLGALLGTSVSSTVAINTSICSEFIKIQQYKYLLTVLLVGSAFIISLLGFGTLIGTLYPVFGYIFAVLLFVSLFKINKKLDTYKDK